MADETGRQFVNAPVVRDIRTVGSFGVVVRLVCGSCNNGWLSGLEERTEPVLAPMFAGLPQLLTDTKAEILATWVLKTALVSTLTFGGTLPATPFRDLYSSRRPSARTVAWCAYRPDFEIHHGCRPLQSKASRGSGHNDGLHAHFILGHVVFGLVTSFGSQPMTNVVLVREQQRAIWPPPIPEDRVWPPPLPLGDDWLALWLDPPYDKVPRPT